MSTAAPLIRWAQADPAFLAAGRLTLAALVLLPLALGTGARFGAWRARHYLLTLVSGLLLGAHFLCWITSLGLTTVASSVFLVTLHPVATALLGQLLHRDAPSRRLWISLLISAAAAAAMVAPDLVHSSVSAGPAGTALRDLHLRGDLLALLGGLAASGYFLAGRSVRRECSTPAYAGLSYAVAAATAWTALAWRSVPVAGQSPRAFAAVALMALGPQLLGHTTFNWALRRLPAAPVAVAATGEPVAASFLAWMLFAERPPWTLALATPLAALGLYLAVSGSAGEDSPAKEVAAGIR